MIRFGARVRLKSGGVVMLVVDIQPFSGEVVCAYRDIDGVHEIRLPSVCVEAV